MQAHFYQYTVAFLIACFIVARTPFVAQYKKSYKTRPESLSPGLTIDKCLVILNSITWVILPLLWCIGFLNYGAFYLPDTLRFVGIALYSGGLIMMWLAHHYLNNNWSALVEVREHHELIQNGIYKHIRHPMYTGFYMQVLGLLLVTSNLTVGLSAIASWQVLYMLRINKEEACLIAEFGDKYIAYQSHTGRLFPKIKA